MRCWGAYRGFALLAAAYLSGCHYHLIRSEAPFGAAKIAVVPFLETNTVGLAPALAQHLTRLLAAGGVALAWDTDDAQAVLDGTLHVSTGANATSLSVSTYQLNATVHATLTDKDGTVLWSTTLGVKEDFLPASASTAPQPMATETNRRMALHRLAERAAAQLHETLLVASAMAPPGAN